MELQPLDPAHDALYLYNSNKHLPVEQQFLYAERTLAFLDSVEAAVQYAPVDLVYLKSVWSKVYVKVLSASD